MQKSRELSSILANAVVSLVEYEYYDPEDYMFPILRVPMLNSFPDKEAFQKTRNLLACCHLTATSLKVSLFTYKCRSVYSVCNLAT